MKIRVFITLILLFTSLTAGAIPILNISGDVTSSSFYTHEFDTSSVDFSSDEGYSLDKMNSSTLGLFETGILAYFNGFTSYLWEDNHGVSRVVNSRNRSEIKYKKHAFIIDANSGDILLDGQLSVYSGWNKVDESGKFMMNFSAKHDHTVATVPEPGTMLLMSSGLIGLLGFARRKRKF